MARLEGTIFVDDPPAQCEPTRAQYMNKEVTFEDYYRAIARDAGVTFVNAPQEFLKRCKCALDSGDTHLNTIPIAQWDSYAYAAQRATSPAFKRHGDFWSLAGGVCIAKQMARDAAIAWKPDSVTRYVVTKLDTSGTSHRTLFDPQQGQYTYATAAEAQSRADAFRTDRHCSDMQLEVRACECWPAHFDPKGIWFD